MFKRSPLRYQIYFVDMKVSKLFSIIEAFKFVIIHLLNLENLTKLFINQSYL